MPTLTFEEVLSLLNHSRTSFIDPVIQRSGPGWALYRGEHHFPMATYPFRVLYLQSRATKEGMEQAAKEIHGSGDLQVVYAPSLESKANSVKKLFERTALGIRTTKEYLSTFIKDELDRYISTLKGQKPPYYIDPRIEIPTGFKRKIPNPLLTFLRDTGQRQDGALVVLLAEPGQGKTYMCRYLVSKLAEGAPDLVPIIIDSSQWQTLTLEDLKSLSKTITHSFSHFHAPISWVEGHEEQFLNVTLKAGMFRIVFDGFDEYILRNRGEVRPLEVLQALSELAATTGTRIVITSRSSFWTMNLPDDDLKVVKEDECALIYEIMPFDQSHARNYFKLRLNDPEKVNQAERVFGLLRSQDEPFVGRGFVLNLIADLTERDGADLGVPDRGPHALRWLLAALCERETLRQQLPLSGDDQLRVLRQFAADLATGDKPETATLEYAIGVARPDLGNDAIADCLEKMKSHPILERSPNADEWGFRQSQAQVLSLADYIIEKMQGDLKTFSARLTVNPEVRQDLAATISALVRHSRSDGEALVMIQKMITSLSDPTIGRPSDGRRLGANLLLAAVDRFLPRGSAHRDRTTRLLQLSGGSSVAGQAFTGTIARFDLAGVQFQKCIFEHVTWANCRFDQLTRFRECMFVGGSLLYCQGFGLADLSTSQLDPDARAWVNNALIADGRKVYTTAELRHDIAALLNKFVGRSGMGLKAVTERNLKTGPISVSKYRDEIIRGLLSNVLDTHHISGISEKGYNVRETAADSVQFFAANNVFTGPLAEAFARLQADLNLA